MGIPYAWRVLGLQFMATEHPQSNKKGSFSESNGFLLLPLKWLVLVNQDCQFPFQNYTFISTAFSLKQTFYASHFTRYFYTILYLNCCPSYLEKKRDTYD